MIVVFKWCFHRNYWQNIFLQAYFKIPKTHLQIISNKNSKTNESILFLVDAVYAMAHALHNMLEEVCGREGKICPAMTPVPSGIDLLKYIRNVSFTSKFILPIDKRDY